MNTDFDIENRREWEKSISRVFPMIIPCSATFDKIEDIANAINHFCRQDLNHTMLADSGGMDILSAQVSQMQNCLELIPSDRVAYICRPAKLHFEYLCESPWNSFLLLETNPLNPSGIYEKLSRPYEELVELRDGSLYDRKCWDLSTIGEDEDGNEIPLPVDARLTARYLGGKFLFVAKRSLWNLSTGTYDGRHCRMTAVEIRRSIENALLPEHVHNSFRRTKF